MNLNWSTGATPAPEFERVHDWRALAEWSAPGTPLAVLGHPIQHSVSPAMHNAALAAMAVDEPRFAHWGYHKFDVPPEALPEALPAFHRAGFLGLNLTIPHKVDALGLVTAIDPGAARMGAVNTLVRHEEGYHGHNSDGYGLAAALRTDLGAALEGATVILLGAGGAARAAAVQCLLDGCAALWIGNRNQDRLAGLLRQIETAGMPGTVRGFDLSDPPDDLPRSGILINATSVGLKPEDPAPIGLERFEPALKVYDMIYNPAETSLLRRARALGMPAANGLSMLVWQGVRSLEIWSGAKVPATAMDAAARAALGRA